MRPDYATPAINDEPPGREKIYAIYLLVLSYIKKYYRQSQSDKVLKITSAILLLTCMQVSARGYTQRVTLHWHNEPLSKIFKEITKQTKVDFFYENQLIDAAGKANIDVENATIDEAMKQCLQHKPLEYKIVANTVLVREKGAVVVASGAAEPEVTDPPIDVKGRVTDTDGNPLIGATIKVKGTNLVTTTNEFGEYTILEVRENAIIEISFIGFETKLAVVKYGQLLNTTLSIAIRSLDETIVQAYGTTSRRYNTGSISKVSTEEINRQPISNPLNALAGRVSGLAITQTSGVPGSSIKLQLRGTNSILQGNDPLFVIDGVPYAPGNTKLNQIGSAANVPGNINSGGLSPFNSINLNDIESIEILKDADATAIYGSRASSGAILITTKKGKAGKTSLSINTYTAFSRINNEMDFLDTSQYLKMRKEAFTNDAITPTMVNAPDLMVWDTTRFTDLKKMLIGNTATSNIFQAILSGGNTNTQFLISGNYYNSTTVFPGGLSDKIISTHISLNHNSTDKKFNVNVSGIYSYDRNNMTSGDLTQYISTIPPNIPSFYDSVGNLNWKSGGVSFNNPLSFLLSKYKGQTYNLISNLQLSYKIVPTFTIKASLGYNNLNLDEIFVRPKSSQNPANNPTGNSEFGNKTIASWIFEPQAEFRTKLSKGKLDLLIGSTWQQITNNSSDITASGYTNDALLESISGASSISGRNNYSKYRYEGFFGRLTYNWIDRYIINFSGRRDGSSRFGPGNQFSNFGAVGCAWIFSKTSFIEKYIPFISFGKIRASYGTTGNDQIGDYQYFDTWTATQYSYQGVSGLQPTGLSNPDYAWEINRKLTGAIEFGFIRDRIQLVSEYFRNRSSNQIISYTLPVQTGFPNLRAKNFPALVENTGLEFSLFSKNVISKKFSWTSSLNVTFYRNRLLRFPGIENSSYSSTYLVGQSLNVFAGYRYIGVDKTTGVFTFEDVDKDGQITFPNDFVRNLGNFDPKCFGGFSNTLSFEGWQFDIFFEFKKQDAKNYSSYQSTLLPGLNFTQNQVVALLDHWQQTGDIARFQKFSVVGGSPATQAYLKYLSSSGILSDASYIRLKNVSLAYNLPNDLGNKLHIKSTRFYIQAQNLFTISNYFGPDPESQNVKVLPPLRTIAVGIQLTF